MTVLYVHIICMLAVFSDLALISNLIRLSCLVCLFTEKGASVLFL